MLKNDFYFIADEYAEDGLYQAGISFDIDHRIFKGHFPGQPVVPGVCMMQIVKEALESHLNTRLNLVKSSGMKFLMVIDPRTTPAVKLLLKYKTNEEGNIFADAQLTNAETTYFKMKGEFNSATDQQGN